MIQENMKPGDLCFFGLFGDIGSANHKNFTIMQVCCTFFWKHSGEMSLSFQQLPDKAVSGEVYLLKTGLQCNLVSREGILQYSIFKPYT